MNTQINISLANQRSAPRYLHRLAGMRTGHRRASESRLAPALLPLQPLCFPFLPAIALKNTPPVSRRRRRYLTGFWGLQGGTPPCVRESDKQKPPHTPTIQK